MKPQSIKVSTHLSEEDEEICIAIFRSIMRTRNTLHQSGSEVAAQLGLHVTEMNVIDMLGKYGTLSMGELARHTFFSPANTTRTVKVLEHQGLVKRERSPDSERVVTVSLTGAGKKTFKQCYPRVLSTIEALLEDRLTGAERKKLAGLLAKLEG